MLEQKQNKNENISFMINIPDELRVSHVDEYREKKSAQRLCTLYPFIVSDKF